MIHLSECNLCILENIKREYGEDRVTVVDAEDHGFAWNEVLVDGNSINVALMNIPDKCICEMEVE